MKNKIVRMTIASALFAAIIFIVTAFLPRIPIAGGAGGYVHLGDAFIYLAACILPFPYGLAAAAIGAGLADTLTGFIIWAPGTVIIKALMALMFSSKTGKILTLRNTISTLSAGLICVAGYYIYEAIITFSLVIPAASVPFNLVQAAASAAVFIAVAFALDKVDIKLKFEKGFFADKL